MFNRKGLVKKLDLVNEYEPRPFSRHKPKSRKSFVGTYTGVHAAGTEFVLGPLFVANGASAGYFFRALVGISWQFLANPFLRQNLMNK